MMNRIELIDFSKHFCIGYKKERTALERLAAVFSGREPQKELQALKNITLQVGEGEALGLIGRNRAGKTTLLRTIADIYPVYEGTKITRGKIIPLIDLGIGLRDRLFMKDSIYLIGSLWGMKQKVTRERFDSIVAFSELGEFVETKLYQFSMGMLQRLAFSVAIHADPEILLLDEVFSAGDEAFRDKCIKRLRELLTGGVSLILVSHDLELVKTLCFRTAWLNRGEIVDLGQTDAVIEKYLGA